MEVKIVEDGKERLLMELPGFDHTFCNHLKKELYSDSAVKEATYMISHPLVGVPSFLVHTDKKAPKTAVKDACKRVKDTNKEFLTAFNKIK